MNKGNLKASEKMHLAVVAAFRAMTHTSAHIENLNAKDKHVEIVQLDVLRTMATPRFQKRVRGMMRERGYHISQSGRPSEQAANADIVRRFKAKLGVKANVKANDKANDEANDANDAKPVKAKRVRKAKPVKAKPVTSPVTSPPELSPDEEISHDSNGGA